MTIAVVGPLTGGGSPGLDQISIRASLLSEMENVHWVFSFQWETGMARPIFCFRKFLAGISSAHLWNAISTSPASGFHHAGLPIL